MPCFASCNHHDLLMNVRHQANLCVLVYTKLVSVFSSNVVRNVKHIIINRMDHICFPKWKVSGQGDNRNMQEIILWTILISKLWDYFNQTNHSCCIWYAHIYLNDFQGQRSRLWQIWDQKQDALCINCQWDTSINRKGLFFLISWFTDILQKKSRVGGREKNPKIYSKA